MEKVNPNAVTVVGIAERKVKMKKVVSAIGSAALAMSVVAVSAFATDGASGVDYTSLIDSLKSGLMYCSLYSVKINIEQDGVICYTYMP